MAKYRAVFEQAEGGTWSGYAPDLPTILVVGDTKEEAVANMDEAVAIWIEEMQSTGQAIPASLRPLAKGL